MPTAVHVTRRIARPAFALLAALGAGCATVPSREANGGDPPRSAAARAAYECAGGVLRRAGLPVVESNLLSGYLRGQVSHAAPLDDAGLNAGRQSVPGRPAGVGNTTPYVVDGLTVLVSQERGTGRALVSAYPFGGASAERTAGYTDRPPPPYLLETAKAARACAAAPPTASTDA
jgi:hypothetical protein